MSSILSNPKQKLNTFHIHSQTNREINVNLNKISEDFDLNFNPKDLESHFKSLSKNEFIYIQSKFPNFSDNECSIEISNLVKYAMLLESELNKKIEEIKRLSYLNDFFNNMKEQRDEMIAHLMLENRKLKENLFFHQRVNEGKIHTRMKSMVEAKPSLPKLSVANFKNSSLLKTQESESRASARTSTLQSFKRKKATNMLRKAASQLSPEKNILSMSTTIEEMKTIYASNESVLFLKSLIDDEDKFSLKINSMEFSSISTLFDAVKHLIDEHKNLYYLVYQLKKLVKAANGISESLILSEAMEKIINECCGFLECDRASVFLLDTQKEELWSKAAKGSDVVIRIPLNSGVVGYVASKGEILNILNPYSDARFNQDVDKKMNYKTNSILCAPIHNKNKQIIGVLQALNKGNGTFSKNDEGLMGILADLAGTVLKNSLNYDKQALFFNSLRHVLNVGIYLNSFIGIGQLIMSAEKKLQSIMNVDQSRIFLYDRKSQGFIRFIENQQTEKYPVSGIAGEIFKTGEIMSVVNGYNNKLFNGSVDIRTNLPLIAMPLQNTNLNQKIIGVMEVVNNKGLMGNSAFYKKSEISEHDIEILQFFVQQLTQNILRNYEFEKMMKRDNDFILIEDEDQKKKEKI